MKKQITIVHYALLIGFAFTFMAAGTQQDKKQNKKEPQQKEVKQHPRQEKEQKQNKEINKGQGNKEVRDNNNRNNNNNARDKEKGTNNKGNDDRRDDNGKNDGIGHNKMKDGYKWDRETFKERNKYRKSDKVTICHKFNRDTEAPVTINVSSHALKAHLDHGDVQGACPSVKNDRYSDNFLRRRTDYYNVVQDNYEQVSYSRSILDYALMRLGASRQQLALMQRNNLPLADIQRKQAVVGELEQNVSLLQTLIGVAANLVADNSGNKFLLLNLQGFYTFLIDFHVNPGGCKMVTYQG